MNMKQNGFSMKKDGVLVENTHKPQLKKHWKFMDFTQ